MCLQNELSGPFPVLKRVKQADILSPLLFNLFINDLITEFNLEESAPPIFTNQRSLLYADDLVIISASESGTQTGLSKLRCLL